MNYLVSNAYRRVRFAVSYIVPSALSIHGDMDIQTSRRTGAAMAMHIRLLHGTEQARSRLTGRIGARRSAHRLRIIKGGFPRAFPLQCAIGQIDAT